MEIDLQVVQFCNMSDSYQAKNGTKSVKGSRTIFSWANTHTRWATIAGQLQKNSTVDPKKT